MLDIQGFLSDGILNNISNFVKTKCNEMELNNTLKQFGKTQKDHFENSSGDFDWDGLQEFVDNEKFRKISAIYLNPDINVRKNIYGNLFQDACTAANATHDLQKDSVEKYISDVIEIVGNYLIGQTENFLPFNQVVNQIDVLLTNMDQGLKEEIKNATNTILNAIAYKGSFEEWVNTRRMPNPSKNPDKNPFHYMNKNIAFYGREEEQQIIDKFLYDERRFLITAITAPAGTGKSKFMYEYTTNVNKHLNWKAIFLTRGADKMPRFTEQDYPTNLLVVIDYAGQYAETLRKWLDEIVSVGTQQNKLRIILLERMSVDEKEIYDSSAAWYDRIVLRGSRIQECWWKHSEKLTIELSALSNEHLKSMINDFSKQKDKPLLEKEKNTIIEYACKIENRDKDRKNKNFRPVRPLIVLIVTEAYITNPSTLNHNLVHLIDEFMKRYKMYWRDPLCESRSDLTQALENLIVYSTATGGWEMNTPLPEPFNTSFKKLTDFFGLQDTTDILKNSVDQHDCLPILAPFEPDLFGEYFVLDHIRRDSIGYLEKVRAFGNQPRYMAFIFRCISDFATISEFENLFEKGMNILLPVELKEKYPLISAINLLVLSSDQEEEKAEETIEAIKMLCDQFPLDQKIIEIYVKGLVNLSTKQDEEKARETIGEIKTLCDQFPSNEDIAVLYAKGLFNLSLDQEEEKAGETIREIKTLCKQFPSNEDISVGYATGLVNLSYDQEEEKARETIWEIKTLCDQFSSNEDIAVRYAKGLFNFSSKQDEEKSRETIGEIKKLCDQFPSNEDIFVEYAKGLFNLSFDQEEEKARETIWEIKTLCDQFPSNEDIAVQFAGGLVNLSYNQDEEKTWETIGEIKTLYNQFPSNEDILVLYAQGLFNLSYKQEEEKAWETISKIKKLYDQFPSNEDISVAYAKGLANLTSDQEEEKAWEVIGEIRTLCYQFPSNEDIAVQFAGGLFNLSSNQEEEKARETIGEIKTLCDQFPSNEGIAVQYVNGLVNLSNKQEEEKARKTIGEIKMLCKQYPSNEDITVRYATALTNFSFDQEEKKARETIGEIKMLCKQFPSNESIAVLYTNGLINLSTKQGEEKARETIGEIKTLCKQFPSNESIAVLYTNGLLNLGGVYYLGNQYDVAAEHFSLAYELGDDNAGTNLAYMKRRGETTIANDKSIDELLNLGLKLDNPMAKLNSYLWMIQKDNQQGWEQADKGMKSLNQTDVDRICRWWVNLYEQGDPEGLLVVVWLKYHRFLNKTLPENTLEKLLDNYPSFPQWLRRDL